ncbi:amino acid adenylation domain-containing protein [Micromonospora sp. NPDC005215]|uniref:non-ribosomal peptide synthetase n=1 Tax=Micromonospora sp. NPDC005215 TaxID=3157024 RepID=UPI0033B2F6CD
MEQDLLVELHRRRIRLQLVDDRIQVQAPPGALTAELREQISGRRDELVSLLRVAGTAEEHILVPRPEDRYLPFPLTDIQHAYWVGHNRAFDLGGVATHFYFELEREGLDVARLETALATVIRRHDMLRAVIDSDGTQRVLSDTPAYRIRFDDFASASAGAYGAHVAGVRAEMAHQVLPPDRWPLFEIRASRHESRVRLHISLDLLIMDAYSFELFFRDWRACYENPDQVPPPLAISYRDHVLAERAEREGPRYRAAETYWLSRVDDLPPAPELPLLRQPAQLDRTEFTRRRAALSADRWRAIKQRARERGVTPSAVLLAAFADVLRLWSKQPDFTVNVTLFNRPETHPDLAQVIGDFTSLTLLEVQDTSDLPFAHRARAVQDQLMRDLEHLSFSGVRVLRERLRRNGPGPGSSMPVVFTSALGLNGESDAPNNMAWFGAYTYGISQTPQVWLDHQVTEEAGQLVYNWDAVEALFPAGLLDDMFASYAALLERLAGPDGGWEDPDLAPAPPDAHLAERRVANETAGPLSDRTLVDLFVARARQDPERNAVLSDNGCLTYGALLRRTEELAWRLVALDATRDQPVAVVLPRHPDQVCAVLGVVAAGAPYLPVDPQWPTARRDQLMKSAGVRVVVTDRRHRDDLDWPEGVTVLAVDDLGPGSARAGTLPPGPAVSDLAYVIFTSGSTGTPKGVMIDHRGAVNTVLDINDRFSVTGRDRVLAVSALSFDLSVYDIFGPLAAGGAVVVLTASAAHDPVHWSELVARFQVTVWNSVPALMRLWLESEGAAAAGPLRLALLSGDWIPVGLPDAVRAHFPQAQVVSLGGATEASIWSVCYPVAAVPEDWVRIPYGRPLRNQKLHVYDHRLGERPIWAVGEIFIAGVGLARGYRDDAVRTAERFITHPRTGELLYRTGDLGRYLPGGDIEFLGREDFQVKINGFRIELGEVTAAVEKQPGVGEALVRVDTNPATGRRHLVAYVVPTAGEAQVAGALDPYGWQQLLDGGRDALANESELRKTDLVEFDGVWASLTSLCLPVVARTFAQLGAFDRAGAEVTAEEIVAGGGVRTEHRGLVCHWLEALAGEGLLDRTGSDRYRCREPFDLAALDATVRAGFADLAATGPGRVLADYLAACAERQLDLLRGRVSPLELLMPEGGFHVTGMLYADNPVSLVQNAVVAAVVARACAAGATRVLEVGAGTGATTAHVLAALPGEGVRYRFTDVSTFFTERARRAFADYPFVDFTPYDVDREPSGQGIARGSMDVVVAANVLHDARDLSLTLRHLRGVLSPGGVLVLLEGTENTLLQTITVGFLEGFSRHAGQRDLPLLTAPEWREELTAAGFAQAAAIPGDRPVTAALAQHVLVAVAPHGGGVDAAKLRAGVEELLPDYMVPHHYLPIDHIPLSANGKTDLAALPDPWNVVEPTTATPPRTGTEATLVEIWRDVLGRADFGVEDNFFELGGDSLHAVHILTRVRDAFALLPEAEAGLQVLFENPTVAAFAAALDGRSVR